MACWLEIGGGCGRCNSSKHRLPPQRPCVRSNRSSPRRGQLNGRVRRDQGVPVVSGKQLVVAGNRRGSHRPREWRGEKGGRTPPDQDDIKGSLDPGKLADLAILEGDYLEATDEELRDMQVAATLVGGRLVHRTDAMSIQ
jgi:hypothetical protein